MRAQPIVLATCLLFGCSDNSGFPPTVNPTRGSYLVNSVLDCGGCHTPIPVAGQPFDLASLLSGGTEFDVQVGANMQKFFAPNLTSDPETGLGKWTDDQIKTAITKGIDNEGNQLFPIMPFWVFGNMAGDDLESIVQYLRTLPATPHEIPSDTFTLPGPVATLDPDKIPHTTLPSTDPRFASAEHGRYIAALAGACIHCHSPIGTTLDEPIDLSRAFAGGQLFPLGPITTVSANLTPDVTGLAGWTASDLVSTVQTDQEKGTGRMLCEPMPGGAQRDGAMTPEDLADVANYLTTLAPISHGPFGCTDGGVPYGLDGAN
jgi:mono/diheme cytochrome c family protein